MIHAYVPGPTGVSRRDLGPEEAVDVVVTDILPADVTYLLDTMGCGLDGLTNGCGIGSLGDWRKLGFDQHSLVASRNPGSPPRATNQVRSEAAAADGRRGPGVRRSGTPR